MDLIVLAFLLGLGLGLVAGWAWRGPRRTSSGWADVPTVSGYAMLETLRRAEQRREREEP